MLRGGWLSNWGESSYWTFYIQHTSPDIQEPLLPTSITCLRPVLDINNVIVIMWESWFSTIYHKTSFVSGDKARSRFSLSEVCCADQFPVLWQRDRFLRINRLHSATYKTKGLKPSWVLQCLCVYFKLFLITFIHSSCSIEMRRQDDSPWCGRLISKHDDFELLSTTLCWSSWVPLSTQAGWSIKVWVVCNGNINKLRKVYVHENISSLFNGLPIMTEGGLVERASLYMY